MDINEDLINREERYGSFPCHAEIAQGLKGIMHAQPAWDKLDPDQRESLDMIQHKIARILNGDPNYSDNWHDIAGYSTLVDNRLSESETLVDGEM